MNLRRFIDFDRELNREPDIGEQGTLTVAGRDRTLGRAFAEAGASKSDEELLEAWRNGVRRKGEASLGDFVYRAARFAAAILLLAGLLVGWGAAAALLRYDGSQPINVLVFFFFLIGLQLLLLPFLVAALISPSLGGRLSGDGSGGITGGVFDLTMKLFSRYGGKASGDLGTAEQGRLRARGSLYREVHPTVLLLLGQIFGVAFNLGVALSLLVRVLFTDLTFAWSTTIQVSPARIHDLTTFLSTPWAWLFPDARPGFELVEATRYVRMDGSFLGAAGDAALLAGAWWPFLLASTVVYGLLPRLLALGLSVWLLRRRMDVALTLSSRVRNLHERLRTPRIVMQASPELPGSSARDRPAAFPSGGAVRAEGRGGAPLELEGLRIAVIHWGYDELPSQAAIVRQVARFFGGSLVRRERAGNPGWSESSLFDDLAGARERGEVDAAAVFFEPFEPPKEDVRRFLRKLRKSLGTTAPIVVVLAEYAGDDLLPARETDRQCWEKGIQQLGDPLLVLNENEVAYG